MSKLLKLKHWVTLPDAARHLSAMFDEAVEVADVLQLGLDGRIKLSVWLDEKVWVQPKKAIPEEEAEKVPGLPIPGKPPYEVTLGVCLSDGTVLVDDGPHAMAKGLYDLAMLGGDRLDVERLCRAYQGLEPRDAINIDGSFIVGIEGSMLQILEPFRDGFIPAPALPDGAHIVVRPSELLALAGGTVKDSNSALAESEALQATLTAELATVKQELQAQRKEGAKAEAMQAALSAALEDINARNAQERERRRAAAAEYVAQIEELTRVQHELERREHEGDEKCSRMADALASLNDAHAQALQELQDRRQQDAMAPQEWAKLLDDLGDLKGRYIHEQERLRATAAELAAQSDTLKRAQADRERRESEADEEYRRMADELARLSGAHVRTLQELQQARKELEQTHLEYSRLLRAESELRDGDALVQQKVQELLEELARMQQEVRAQPSSASPEVERRSGGDRRKGWPWGMHETERLRHLAAAAARFWVNFDPADSTTAPTNEDVSAWLQRECGQTKRAADAMATILRADGLPTGPRV